MAQTGTAFDKACSAQINGEVTNFVFQRFSNKYFVIVTQNSRMSNLFTIRFETEPQDFPDKPKAAVPLHIVHNFGEDTDEIRSAVQFLVSNSKLKNCPSEIVMSVAIKEINGKCLKEIAAVLDSIL